MEGLGTDWGVSRSLDLLMSAAVEAPNMERPPGSAPMGTTLAAAAEGIDPPLEGSRG